MGLSDDGSVVALTVFDPSQSSLAAARWTVAGGLEILSEPSSALRMTTAWAITGNGLTIAGQAITPAGPRAARWTVANGTEVLSGLPSGSLISESVWIAPDGTVIFGIVSPPGSYQETRPFRWTAQDGAVLLGSMPGYESYTQISRATPDGRLAVGTIDGSEAIVWSASGGYRLVRQILASAGISLGNDSLQHATGISADGSVITGTGSHEGRQSGWVIHWSGDTCTPPRIGEVSRSVHTCPGRGVRLAIGLAGSTPYTIQWNRGGVPVIGATSEVLNIPNAVTDDTGSYTCLVSNPCGSAESDPIDVLVCLADYDCNGFVNGDDFDRFVTDFEIEDEQTDVNHDGSVGEDDFHAFTAAFVAGC